LLTIEQLNN